VKWDAKKADKKVERLRKIVKEAAKPLEGVTFEIKRIESFEKISNDGTVIKEETKPVKDDAITKVTNAK
ncbi:hypothetical protein ACT453_62205, partial [Bacillus sp. D-CC]